MENCLPRHGTCPEGYHSTDGDETGQCYPNCKEAALIIDGERFEFKLLTDRPDNKADICADPAYICNDDEHKEKEYCIEYCDKDPDSDVCKIDDSSSNVR